VLGLSAVDNLLGVPTEDLLAAYAPQVPRRARFAGCDTLIDTTRAQAVLGLRLGRSIHGTVSQ